MRIHSRLIAIVVALTLLIGCRSSGEQLALDLEPSLDRIAPRYYDAIDADPTLIDEQRAAKRAPMQAVEDRIDVELGRPPRHASSR